MTRSRDKGNRLERETMRVLLLVDGECPNLGHLASSTGRTGHLTDLQVDGLSKSFAVECKNRESLPNWLWGSIRQICHIAPRYHKQPLTVLKKNHRPALAVVDFDWLVDLLRRTDAPPPPT